MICCATQQPHFKQATGSRPLNIPAKNPAANASPAPVVSPILLASIFGTEIVSSLPPLCAQRNHITFSLVDMATSAAPSGLPSECFLHPESDDEESFVVLCRSLPPDTDASLAEDCAAGIEPIETSAVQESLKLTSSALSQLNNSASSFPPLPAVNDQELSLLTLEERAPSQATQNSSVDLSPDEIQQKLDSLIDENMKLKETLHQNNLAMKKQYETLVLWQEDVMKVHQSHKEKFADTKKFIENLKQENVKLAENLKMSQSAQEQLKEEMLSLKTEKDKTEPQSQDAAEYSLLKGSFDNLSKFELEGVKKKLEEVQVQAAGKIANLEQQVNNLLMEKADWQKSSGTQTAFAGQVENLEKELDAAKQLNIQVAAENTKRQRESEALQKILLEEIKVLKEQIKEKAASPIAKETHENVQEQLMAAQMHITKLELLRNEDKELLNTKEDELRKLQTVVKEMSEDIDTITALRTQLELYKSDFEAERQAKEALRSEKEQVADDLRHLQRRNQQLLEEVERLRGGDFVHVVRPESPPTASAPQDGPERQFSCPKCNFKFYDYQALENHVYRCIEIDNLF